MLRNSACEKLAMSRPSKRIAPLVIRPTPGRSRMMASATVDLPQPDSPTSPIACPGMTRHEKSMTAGISPPRVKNEMPRRSISSSGSTIASPSIAQRLLADRVGEQVQAEHERHQRQGRGQGGVSVDAHEASRYVDHCV